MSRPIATDALIGDDAPHRTVAVTSIPSSLARWGVALLAATLAVQIASVLILSSRLDTIAQTIAIK